MSPYTRKGRTSSRKIIAHFVLSHVRNAKERAVIDELDELVTPDCMQFGFRRAVKNLQAAIDVADILNEAIDYLVAVLDLT